MNICDNPYSIPAIDINECIGLSLPTLNSNFDNLKLDTCLTVDQIDELTTNYSNLSTLCQTLQTYTSSGMAKAMIVFNGSTLAAYLSYGISSITRNGASGDYRLTFSNAFPDTNYALVTTSSELTGSGVTYTWTQPTKFTTTYVSLSTHGYNASIQSPVNPTKISVAIFANTSGGYIS